MQNFNNDLLKKASIIRYDVISFFLLSYEKLSYFQNLQNEQIFILLTYIRKNVKNK